MLVLRGRARPVSDDTDHVRIIKDQYQADGRCYDKGMLFDILQQDLPDNRAPGCVHVECHGAVVGVHTPVVATVDTETKEAYGDVHFGRVAL